MFKLPLSLIEWLGQRGIIRRPWLLCVDVSEAPLDSGLTPSILYREVRGGYPKWAHFACPRCRAHIQIQIAANSQWRLSVDWLRRPTLHPSIWETESCGAHFFVRSGGLFWCD
jgi:hypothetical protein